jgi:hypothetical protein
MDAQPVNPGAAPGTAAPAAPEASQRYSIPPGMTPEAADARAKELVADKEFGARFLRGGKDSREARELDALQRLGAGARPEVPRKRPAAVAGARTQAQAPATTQPSVGLTREAAKEQLAELRSDQEWVKARMSNGPDSAQAHQEDALQRIAVGAAANPAAVPAGVAELTAAQARARLAELRADEPWQKRFFAGDLKAKKEFDYLTEAAAKVAEPGAPPGASPPANLSAYVLPFGVKVGETEGALANFNQSREVAAEHGITPGAYQGIVEQQVADEQRFATMTEVEVGEKLRADLRAIWKNDYDHHAKNVQRYLRENPALEAKLQNLMGYGHDRASIVNKVLICELSVLAAAKYGLPARTR